MFIIVIYVLLTFGIDPFSMFSLTPLLPVSFCTFVYDLSVSTLCLFDHVYCLAPNKPLVSTLLHLGPHFLHSQSPIPNRETVKKSTGNYYYFFNINVFLILSLFLSIWEPITPLFLQLLSHAIRSTAYTSSLAAQRDLAILRATRLPQAASSRLSAVTPGARGACNAAI